MMTEVKAMTRVFASLVTALFAVAIGPEALAEQPANPGKLLRYVVVLKSSAGTEEPDAKKVGGRELSRWKNRRVVELPRPAIEALSRHPAVHYLALVNDGTETDAPRYVRGQITSSVMRLQSNEDPAWTWSSGDYLYDASGNITAIGSNSYRYDKAQRLAKAVTGGETIEYKYDSFGNQVERKVGSVVVRTDTSVRSNQLDGASYDRAGNQLSPTTGVREFQYDAANMVVERKGLSTRRYIYTADDERIGTKTGSNEWRWTIRDFNGKVLSTFSSWSYSELAPWEWLESHHYRDSALSSATKLEEHLENEGSSRYFHLDHLGSPRLITNQSGQRISSHDYQPFGREQTDHTQETTQWRYAAIEPMKFTGHERDFMSSADPDAHDYLDYMHARYYNPSWGRFLSVDPVLDVKKALREPQRWNRYSYVINNPLRFTDPTGREVALPAACASNIPCKEIRDLRNGLPPELRLYVRATTLKDGRVVLNKSMLNAVRDTMGSTNFATLRQVANHKDTVRVSTSESGFLRFDFGTQKLMADTYKKGGDYLGYALTPNESKLALTFVSVNPTDDPRTAAETLAHELYGHAARYLVGLPYKHSQVPRQVFADIQREATENYDSWP